MKGEGGRLNVGLQSGEFQLMITTPCPAHAQLSDLKADS